MAGDWIKLRIDLQTHPKVVRILSATKSDKFRAIGGLHAVWSVFDTHSQDGILRGYTPETLDHIIGWPGFAAAMIAVSWLEYDGAETLKLPEFSEHNGKSGKRRAEDQKRKRDSRTGPQFVRNLSGEDADENRTREEKRRDKKKPTVSCSDEDVRCAVFIFQKIETAVPGTKTPKLDKWANTIRLMREQDGLTHHRIVEVFNWANKDPFWKTNILSPDKLREKFPVLAVKLEETRGQRNQSAKSTASDRLGSELDKAFGPGDAIGSVLEGDFQRVGESENAH